MGDNSVDAKSSRCYSVIAPTPTVKDLIVELLEHSEIELTPKEIATKLNLNHSSVRVYLPQLVAQNRIITPYKGAYCSKVTDMVKFQGVRVHNIVATADAVVKEHFDDTQKIGGVKVRVILGVQNQKVSIFISNDLGMDKDTCLLALDRAFLMAKEKLGYCLEDIVLQTFELNRDYLGVRVDRATCVTRKGLYDVVERVYQKDFGVRHEYKISKEMPMKEFEALLQGGVTSYNIMQANFALVQEVRKLGEALKMTNSQLLQQSKVLEGILKWIYKQNDDGKNG